MYGKRVRNTETGETGIVVQRPVEGCPNLSVAPDTHPRDTVCWPIVNCSIVSNSSN